MAAKMARRNFFIVVDGEKQFYYAGEMIPDEIVNMIDSPSIFDGESNFSPGNPDHEEPDTGLKRFPGRERTGFDKMTVAELIQYAKDTDVELPAHARKSDLIAALVDAEVEAP